MLTRQIKNMLLTLNFKQQFSNWLVVVLFIALISACQSGSSVATLLVPKASTGFKVTAGTDNGVVQLSWNKAIRAKSYSLQYSTSTNSEKKTVANITDTKYTLSGLTSNQTYTFTVSAINEGGSASSAELKYFLAKVDFAITSTSFTNGGVMPEKMGAETHVSPQISWKNLPSGVQSFAVVMGRTNNITTGYWSVTNIPVSQTSIVEGAYSASSSPDALFVYTGPSLAANTSSTFLVEVLALDSATLNLNNVKTTRNALRLLANARGVGILASATMSGTYKGPQFSVSSTTFTDGGVLPIRMADNSRGGFTGGTNTSPHIAWTNPPTETKAFAIVMEDQQATNYPHWNRLITFSSTRSVSEAVGSVTGYLGPRPPSGTHTYIIEVFALSSDPGIIPAAAGGARRTEFRDVMATRGITILGSATITGTFSAAP